MMTLIDDSDIAMWIT